ncbi:MAG: hypothetical protein ACRBCS_16080 [Cellvibrionaceae bacterium]
MIKKIDPDAILSLKITLFVVFIILSVSGGIFLLGLILTAPIYFGFITVGSSIAGTPADVSGLWESDNFFIYFLCISCFIFCCFKLRKIQGE